MREALELARQAEANGEVPVGAVVVLGGVRSKFHLADSDLLNHRLEVVEGVLAGDCLTLVKDFFEARR